MHKEALLRGRSVSRAARGFDPEGSTLDERSALSCEILLVRGEGSRFSKHLPVSDWWDEHVRVLVESAPGAEQDSGVHDNEPTEEWESEKKIKCWVLFVHIISS